LIHYNNIPPSRKVSLWESCISCLLPLHGELLVVVYHITLPPPHSAPSIGIVLGDLNQYWKIQYCLLSEFKFVVDFERVLLPYPVSVCHAWSVSLGSLASVKAILEIAGERCLEHRDNQYRTPLHLATMGGHGEVVNFLLSQEG